MIAMLRWLLGRRITADIEGDLLEERARRAKRSPFLARVWFIAEAARIVASALLSRFAGSLSSVRNLWPGTRGSWNELKQALRSIARSPWYAATVVTVLALTGAMATTAFAIADGVLFKAPPYPNPDELYTAGGPGGAVLSLKDRDAWRRAAPEVRLSLVQHTYVLGAVGEFPPRPIRAAAVDDAFFDVLGQQPRFGRWRAEDFESGGGRRRVLLSDALWRRMFGGRPDAIGQQFEIAGGADHRRVRMDRFEVAGVLPAEFVFPDNAGTPDLLLPMAITSDRRDSRNDAVGWALIRTSADVASLPARLLAAYDDGGTTPPRRAERSHVSIWKLSEFMLLVQGDSLRSSFVAAMVLMAVGLLNVACLAFLRGEHRLHEAGLRMALGATRRALFRLAILDAAPLSLAGFVLSLVLAPWLIAVAISLIPSYVVFLKTPGIDWRVVVFWAGLVTTALLVLAAARARAFSSARYVASSVRGASNRTRFGWYAIGLQVALSFTVVLAGTLMLGTLRQLWKEPIGYPTTERTVVEVSHRNADVDLRRAVIADLVDRLRAVPNVRRVALVGGSGFLARSREVWTFDLPEGIRPGREGLWTVAGDYFDLMRLTPVTGRLFTQEEYRTRPPVLILSEQVAKRYFPAGPAVGNTLTARKLPYDIVGVVRDVQISGINDRNGGQIYVAGPSVQTANVFLVEGPSTGPALAAAIADANSVAITRVQSFTTGLGAAIQIRTFRAWLFGLLSLGTVILVGVGVFGLVAMTTGRRTRELAIRTALGATRPSIVGMIVREQLIPVVLGLAAGGLVSMWAIGFVKSYLFGVSATETWVWMLSATIVLAVAALGALIPAMSASRIDPIRALNNA
jgi:predicted permease